MKVLLALCCIFLIGISIGCTQQDAEDTWTKNIYPATNDTYDIGSSTLLYHSGYFTDLHVSNDSLYIGEMKVTAVDLNNFLKGSSSCSCVNGTDDRDGHTPILGIDYFNGVNGSKGDKGEQGIQGPQGIQGVNGSNPDAITTINLSDDFMTGSLATGAVGSLGWAFVVAPTYIASVANHVGIRQVATTNVSANINSLYTGSAATNDIIQYSEQWDFTFIVNVPNISSVDVFVGAIDGVSTAVGNQDRYGFNFNTSINSSNWIMCTGNGTASTKVNTSTSVVAGTWYKLRVVRTGTGVNYYINGVSSGSTITTTLPDTFLSFGYHIKTLAAYIKSLQIDLFSASLVGIVR